MIEQYHDTRSYVQFDQYQCFPEVVHGIFTRQGGISAEPFASLNTSAPLRNGDSFDNVVHNRRLALQALGIQPPYVTATLWQVHGAEVMVYDAESPWRTDWAYRSYYDQPWTPETIHKADAIITNQRGVALALSFADCTPILFYDPVKQAIGMAHGGWRGTARGIVAATVDAMQEQFGSNPRDIRAGIGPAIGDCCYEVSENVRQLFVGELAFEDMPIREHYRKLVCESAAFSTVQLPDRTSLRLDLATTNHNQLLQAGLRPEHIEVSGICTGCNTDRFFSHRCEQGRTGRFPAIIMLQER